LRPKCRVCPGKLDSAATAAEEEENKLDELFQPKAPVNDSMGAMIEYLTVIQLRKRFRSVRKVFKQ